MGLKSAVANAVASGFNALGASSADGLQTEMTYTQVTTGSYDPTTGKTSNTTSNSTIDVVYYKVKDKEVDGVKIKINDIRVIFPQSRLSVTPSQNDYVTLLGKKMEIVQHSQDPAGATYTLFLRGV